MCLGQPQANMVPLQALFPHLGPSQAELATMRQESAAALQSVVSKIGLVNLSASTDKQANSDLHMCCIWLMKEYAACKSTVPRA